jgi:glycosyltransferase involved in cell wall biosynthesis
METAPTPVPTTDSSISVVLITKNEEHNIRDCLKSVDWADEVVVVDAESQDRTRELAGEYTQRVFVRPWPGFGAQKNFGINQAASDWILILDADERVSPELKDEIQNLVLSWSAADPVAFEIPRRNIFYGKWVRWGGAYPDCQIRLFRKGKAQYNDVEVHENLLISGVVGALKGHFIHYTERHIVDHFRKFNLYTTLAAREKRKLVDHVRWYHLLFNPLIVFLKSYVLRRGFRDGMRGFIFAVFASMYTFVKYAKLWEILYSPSNNLTKNS